MSNDPYSLFYMPKSTQGPDYSKIDSGGGGSSYSWPPKLGEAGGTDHLAMVAQRRRRIQQQHNTNMGQAPGVMGGPIVAPSAPSPYGGSAAMTSDPRSAFGGGFVNDPNAWGTAGVPQAYSAQVNPANGGARMQQDQAMTPEQRATQLAAQQQWQANPNAGWGQTTPEQLAAMAAAPPPNIPYNPTGPNDAVGVGGPPVDPGQAMREATLARSRALEGQMPTMNDQPYTAAMQNQWAGWGGVAGGPANPGGYTTGPFAGAAQGGAGGAVPGAGGGAGGTAPGTVPGAPGAWTPPAWNPATGGLINNQPTATGRPEDHPMYANIRDRMTQLLASGNLAAAQQMMRGLG